ncbi:3-PAP domain-containing protein [Trichostrongylus colubriformis]|uniref:3-PAP domain-containing protein n=1 Tax=Trichostrongylus colubriformis TaxID=6319 RepID=A0AAN8G5H6_TRICO
MVPAFSASSVADQLASNITGSPFPLERFFHESYTRLFISVTNIGAAIVEKSSGMPLIYEVLRPPRTIVDVQLWNECYLRWIPAANVTRGGSVVEDLALKEVIEEEFPSSIAVLSRLGATSVDMDKVSSAHPYSTADVNHRGYFANRDSDSLSISSMSLSVHEDRWKVSLFFPL